MKTITVYNNRGGCSKSSTCLALAALLQEKKKKVLFLDIDPQCNSTSSYRAEMENVATMCDVLAGDVSSKEAIQHTEIGDIIASDRLLSKDEARYLGSVSGFNKVKNICKEVEADYDYCVIDVPPNLGIYSTNALIAADICLIPIRADKYGVDGLRTVLEAIRDVQENANENLKIGGVLLTAYDARKALDKRFINELPGVCKEIGVPFFKTVVRVDQTVPDSQAASNPLTKYPKSKALEDYRNVLKELLKGVK